MMHHWSRNMLAVYLSPFYLVVVLQKFQLKTDCSVVPSLASDQLFMLHWIIVCETYRQWLYSIAAVVHIVIVCFMHKDET